MLRNAASLAIAACLILSAGIGAAHAQGFAALVSPPRFELEVKPGESHREVIEITNASGQPAKYHTRTADWTLGVDGSVKFEPDALQPGSCRPWVALEARDITVSPGYAYERAPDQQHFLTRETTKNIFRDIFRMGKERAKQGKTKWRFSQSPLFMDFLAGNQTYECTPWGLPTTPRTTISGS